MFRQKISSSRPSTPTVESEASSSEVSQTSDRPRPMADEVAGPLGELQSMRLQTPGKSGRRPVFGLKLDIAGMRKKETESLDRLRRVSNGSTHFHGSRSGSLITFHPSTNVEIRGSLLPMGTLLAREAAVFSGERGNSLEDRAFNKHHLSVVGEANFDQAVQYATNKQYASSSPIRTRLSVGPRLGAHSSADNAERLRQVADAKLDELGSDSEMARFVSANFPLIYGLKPGHDKIVGISSSIPGECGINGGCDPSQISVIFAPDEEVQSVEKYMAECGFQIPVKPLSSVRTG
ncbi:hypothetical protein Y603_1869 [Burkholderia pseudomallei MSHR1153]|nr:hypothetical protein Y603_1869 [Burkholderia pseudomallei MSHR1153]